MKNTYTVECKHHEGSYGVSFAMPHDENELFVIASLGQDGKAGVVIAEAIIDGGYEVIAAGRFTTSQFEDQVKRAAANMRFPDPEAVWAKVVKYLLTFE